MRTTLSTFALVFILVTLSSSSAEHLNPRATKAKAKAKVSPVKKAAKTWTLVPEQSYKGKDFFDGFNFDIFPDPTKGQVNYTDADYARSQGLAYVNSAGRAVIQVDYKNDLKKGENRNSVRLSSFNHWQPGQMMIIDVYRSPFGCGVWPAIWTTGFGWPWGGEVDIVEGINNRRQNQMNLHTEDGCKLAPKMKGGATGQVLETDCNAHINNNRGCGVRDPSMNSFGSALNQVGGAVWAVLWADTGITIWRFFRWQVPSDITRGKPDPTNWPRPVAFWANSDCDLSTYFPTHHALVINIALCGTWQDAGYAKDGCPGTCSDRVRKGDNWRDARWEINSILTYE